MFQIADYEYIVSEDDWIIYNHKEYYFSKEAMPMEKARDYCKKNGGDLAVIDSESERTFLWKYVRKSLQKIKFYPLLRPLFQLASDISESSLHNKKLMLPFISLTT